MIEKSVKEYYARRAPEYDRIYEKPERQEDLAALKEIIRQTFRGEDVLEVACGTGFWTEILAEVARTVTAIDVNESVLQIARTRPGAERVRFERADVFALPDLPAATSCLAGFWWSHIEKSRIAPFLDGLHRKLQSGARVMFMDNCYVPASSTAISRTDLEGNSYQTRTLADGSSYEVVKNFPTESELREAVAIDGEQVNVRWMTYYWILSYRLKRK